MYHINEEIIGSGESITLNNTAQKYFKLFEIHGNSKQIGTPSITNVVLIQNCENNINIVIDNENSDTDTNKQSYIFPLNQKFMLDDYLANDGIHHVRKQVTFNGKTITLDDAKENGKYLCTHKVSGVLEGKTLTLTSEANDVIVEYELAVEEIEEYTQQQQEIYNTIAKEAYSYKDKTVIYSTNTIAPILNVIAFKGISEEFKQRIKEGKITRAYLKVLETDTEPEFIINENNYLKDLKFEELRYIPDEGFIGGTVAKKLSGNFNNVDSSFNIQEREIEAYLGVEMEDGTTEYIRYGTYIVQSPQDNQVTDNTSFEALDYMIKFNREYVDRISYPCTMKDLLNDIIEQAGVGSKIATFPNENFTIENNQFETGATLRNILNAIAQMAFNWARVDSEDNLVFDFEIKNETDETITPDECFNFIKANEFGPINVITLRNSQVEGENITIKDDQSIETYGETELVISDNPFAYTQEKRAQLIEAGRRMFGLRYTPMTLEMIGLMYLNATDRIAVDNLNGQTYYTYLFDHTINYNGTVLDSMQSQAKTKMQTQYQFSPAMIQSLKHTEALVDKANQEIILITERQEETNKDVTELKVTLEGVTSTVANKDEVQEQINELKQTIEGTTNTITTIGGNNVFYYSTEYWESLLEGYDLGIETITNTFIKQNTVAGFAYLLNQCHVIQKQTVKNGFYTISYLYSKVKGAATGYIVINGNRYDLTAEESDKWYENVITLDITTNTIEIEIVCDSEGGFYFGDLMVAGGDEKQVWSQNANETLTDTVQIGKGVQVNSSSANSYTRMDADGNRTFNSITGELSAEISKDGIYANELEVKGQAKINGLLIQTVDNQIWISSLL